MPHATLADALAYSELTTEDVPTVKADALLEDAAGWVSSFASPPTDPAFLADYAARAKRAEMRVFSYLVETGNLKSSSSPDTGSETYVDPEHVEKLMKISMRAKGSTGSARITSLPIRRG